MNNGCIQSGQQSTNSENVDMIFSSVILTVTMEMMSSTLKAAIINFLPLEGRRTSKQADRHAALKYYPLIKFANIADIYCLITHPADTEQHYYPTELVSGNRSSTK